MKKVRALALLGAIAACGIAGTATAQEVIVDKDITMSTTWTANNYYNLSTQIYVRNGATLTIEPGTVIASDVSVNGSGSLAITRGSKIIAKGTVNEPIIFTSKNDVYGGPGVTLPDGSPYNGWDVDGSHPTGRNPETGAWRVGANEWGNLTILGRGYCSNTIDVPANSSTCAATNVSPMEGLTEAFPGDTRVLFGGGDDDDDSGSLEYVSIRYAGRVVGLGNELNGLSLGAVGRGTDINHIEIMNNIDDGVEIWGGTVCLKYISIWNVGDDSFDVDQGWRGCAQFVLIVQGYSTNTISSNEGSGICDNVFEIDGAEMADAQPVTTAQIYNATVIGQPAAGDSGTAWRDGARVQFRNCIFMDLGSRLVKADLTDGEGSMGWSLNGTLPFFDNGTASDVAFGDGNGDGVNDPDVWDTPYNAVPAHANDCSAAVYQAQTAGNAAIGQGFLAEITDSVFFRNPNPNAYVNSDILGVTVAGGDAPAKGNHVTPGIADVDAPVTTVTRTAAENVNGRLLFRVTSLDPRATNDALLNTSMAPDNGFYTPADYRGAFGPDENWLCFWTAADAYGISIAPPGGCVKPCIWDIANAGGAGADGNVDVFDLLELLANWNSNGPGAAISSDGGGPAIVDVFDLLELLANWNSPNC